MNDPNDPRPFRPDVDLLSAPLPALREEGLYDASGRQVGKRLADGSAQLFNETSRGVAMALDTQPLQVMLDKANEALQATARAQFKQRNFEMDAIDAQNKGMPLGGLIGWCEKFGNNLAHAAVARELRAKGREVALETAAAYGSMVTTMAQGQLEGFTRSVMSGFEESDYERDWRREVAKTIHYSDLELAPKRTKNNHKATMADKANATELASQQLKNDRDIKIAEIDGGAKAAKLAHDYSIEVMNNTARIYPVLAEMRFIYSKDPNDKALFIIKAAEDLTMKMQDFSTMMTEAERTQWGPTIQSIFDKIMRDVADYYASNGGAK